MNKVGKITILTPCYNSEKYIEETVGSVINQNAVIKGKVELEYIICDGNSTDKTIALIKSFNSSQIKIISEPDNGMYDALAKGLQLATGDIIAYLNAGDYYQKYAFDTVIEVFESNLDIKWISGLIVYYNENSQVIDVKTPFRYRKSLIKSGIYGEVLPYIQQESVFWKYSLTNGINLEKLGSFKLAGDYFLWYSFSEMAELFIVNSYLGGFKVHEGQQSELIQEYNNEKSSFCERKTVSSYLMALIDLVCWQFPSFLKKKLNASYFISFDLEAKKWI
ncbi:glycosyltransferase [Flexithrix dorotheae]|uniref:glycosyltransferase n=1 Tax=Flexithrix dorotheae TaxID=70993 RepID=UPI000371657E|nr:glycosyltransferase [Flexithrix dorotheae]